MLIFCYFLVVFSILYLSLQNSSIKNIYQVTTKKKCVFLPSGTNALIGRQKIAMESDVMSIVMKILDIRKYYSEKTSIFFFKKRFRYPYRRTSTF